MTKQKLYKVHVKSKNIVLANNVRIARSFTERLIGLMFSKKMDGYDGLMIERCNSIHTCFMNYAIDVLFLDRNDKVKTICRAVAPWRMTWFYVGAVRALELEANSIPENVGINDEVELICIN